jgi:peptidoglycan L-alanyl-D-glutamate endopeptidase CwlK
MSTDNVSLARLNQLHPKLRQKAIEAYNEAVRHTPANVHPVVVQTLRTFEEQELLYEKGRSRPGPKVTDAKPGSSYHNYGLAIDFCLKIDGKLSWVVDENWKKVAGIFKAHGFSWGGEWTSLKDYPHVENNFGHNWRELLAFHNAGKVDSEGYVLI